MRQQDLQLELNQEVLLKIILMLTFISPPSLFRKNYSNAPKSAPTRPTTGVKSRTAAKDSPNANICFTSELILQMNLVDFTLPKTISICYIHHIPNHFFKTSYFPTIIEVIFVFFLRDSAINAKKKSLYLALQTDLNVN